MTITRIERMPEIKTEAPSAVFANASLRIIATAIVFACIYYASSILITLICALIIAFVLDPGVALMERMRVPPVSPQPPQADTQPQQTEAHARADCHQRRLRRRKPS